MAVNLLDSMRARRRLWIVFVLTLLPLPAVWFGMYRLDSLVWTFVLYHGVCLLPAAILGRRLWLPTVKWPTRNQCLALGLAVVIVLPLAPVVWAWVGTRFISPHGLLSVVTARGFRAAWLLPLGCYFVPVNAALEELFWRGVVLNELRGTGEAFWTAGAFWTAFAFAGWHYLVLRLLLRPGWAEAAVLLILAAGVFLAWLYRRTHSIIVPILWHSLVFDLALIVIFAAVLQAK
jgi:membrane protease YdiL (CAAX protease family)